MRSKHNVEAVAEKDVSARELLVIVLAVLRHEFESWSLKGGLEIDQHLLPPLAERRLGMIERHDVDSLAVHSEAQTRDAPVLLPWVPRILHVVGYLIRLEDDLTELAQARHSVDCDRLYPNGTESAFDATSE